MKKFICLLFTIIVLAGTKLQSQPLNLQPDGGGSYTKLIQIKEEISEQQRADIVKMLQQNEQQLRSQGVLSQTLSPTATAFTWPLKQALGYNDNGYYAISNYIDHNAAYPNAITDYNCGGRSYDLASGYNHKGTDIFTWPFSWQKMASNAVEIIAAADGTIIGKNDNNFDQNCAFCTGACNWNAVYVMHTDGSVAWYGHMKTGSPTPKNIGQTVAAGEYLGVVGSSGNSTGPHLHFEVYTNSSYTQLVDPWAGSCNALNGFTSWWANQQPYYVPTLNKVMTHVAAPVAGQCPNQEIVNDKINFTGGQTLYLASYYRDQQNGQQSLHRVYRPDNVLYSNWTQNFNGYYEASYWYYTLTLPASALTGMWRYEITFNGTQKVTSYFSVNNAPISICPSNNNTLFANIAGSTYQWQVNTGAGFTDIADGTYYGAVNTGQLQLKNIPSSFYGYQYRCFVNGNTYSNIVWLKFTGYWLGAKSSSWEDPANWSCGNVPDAYTDVIVNSGSSFYPEVGSNAVCRSTTVQPTAFIELKTGFNLTITGK